MNTRDNRERYNYREIDREIDVSVPHGLPERQILILKHMQRAKFLSTVMLAHILGITQQKVQRAVRSLEIRGLIWRITYDDGTRAYRMPHLKPQNSDHRVLGVLYARLVATYPDWRMECIIERGRYFLVTTKPDGEKLLFLVPRTYAEKADVYVVEEQRIGNITTDGQKYIIFENLKDYSTPLEFRARKVK